MVKPISKQILKAQKRMIQDNIDKENEQINSIQIKIEELKVKKDEHVAKKNAWQSDINDIDTDIGA